MSSSDPVSYFAPGTPLRARFDDLLSLIQARGTDGVEATYAVRALPIPQPRIVAMTANVLGRGPGGRHGRLCLQAHQAGQLKESDQCRDTCAARLNRQSTIS